LKLKLTCCATCRRPFARRRGDIPALQAIDKKARTVYAVLAGFEFAAASPLIAGDRVRYQRKDRTLF